MYIHIYIYTYMYIYTYICTYMYMFEFIHVFMCFVTVYSPTFCIRAVGSKQLQLHLQLDITKYHAYKCICLYAYIYIYIYIYIHFVTGSRILHCNQRHCAPGPPHCGEWWRPISWLQILPNMPLRDQVLVCRCSVPIASWRLLSFADCFSLAIASIWRLLQVCTGCLHGRDMV